MLWYVLKIPMHQCFYMAVCQNPGTPGEHQNSWYMDVHPPKNGIDRY